MDQQQNSDDGVDAGTIHRAHLLPYANITPTLDPTVFVGQGSIIVGDVHIGRDSSVWFNAVIRGDVHEIRIGERTNIQDLAMLHVQCNMHSLTIGNGVTVGHSVVLHGCIVEDYAQIGMNATVLNGAVVSAYSIVAAGAVVRENFVVPPRTLVAGVPAKIIRELTDEECKKLEQGAQNYIDYVRSYRENFNIRTQR
ncbi:MAG: gamma carbonic anhydrase family protein [Ignavibacteria bacterium]